MDHLRHFYENQLQLHFILRNFLSFCEMNSKTYVTDPSMWETFYKNMADKTFNPYKYRKQWTKNQIGRGLHGRYRGSYMIPVNLNAIEKYTDQIPTTMVSPVAAAEERALSEMKSEQEKPHVVIRKKNKSRRKRNKQKQISVHKKIKKEKKPKKRQFKKKE